MPEMTDKGYREVTVDELWEDIDLWMHNYRAAHEEDERDDIDIYLDNTVYKPNSPYWPLRDSSGTLVDWHSAVEK